MIAKCWVILYSSDQKVGHPNFVHEKSLRPLYIKWCEITETEKSFHCWHCYMHWCTHVGINTDWCKMTTTTATAVLRMYICNTRFGQQNCLIHEHFCCVVWLEIASMGLVQFCAKTECHCWVVKSNTCYCISLCLTVLCRNFGQLKSTQRGTLSV